MEWCLLSKHEAPSSNPSTTKKKKKKKKEELFNMDKAMHTCNPSTGEAEAGGWQVQGQPVLFSLSAK
jgi:hypothetical protein